MTSATSNHLESSRPARLPRPARYAQVLDAARHVFASCGYHGAAMDDIAERAGVSKPVLYQHFPSKLDLYLALLDVHCELLVARVQEAMGPTRAGRKRVRTAIQAYFEFIDHEGEAFRLVFESDLRNQPEVRARVERMEQRCITAIAGIISADMDETHEATEILAAGLVGMATATARYWVDHGRPIPRAEAERLAILLAARGIRGFPAHDAPQ